MPTFPIYDGELPSCLNPWNPRHYLLVLYWVYFRPTALKCYLYQADPELYRDGEGWDSFNKGFRVSAYRNLWIIAFITIVALSAIFMLMGSVSLEFYKSNYYSCPTAVPDDAPVEQVKKLCDYVDLESERLTWNYWAQWFPRYWLLMLRKLTFGVAFGVVFGVATSFTIGIASGVALGISLSISISVTGVVMSGA